MTTRGAAWPERVHSAARRSRNSCGRKLLREQQAEGFFEDIRIWFVGQSKDADGLRFAPMALHEVSKGLDLRAIENVGGFRKTGGSAHAGSQRGERAVVAGEAWPSVTYSAL